MDDQGRFGKRAQNFIGALAQIKSGVVPTKAIIPDDSTRALRIRYVVQLSSAQKILLNPLGLKIPKHFRVPYAIESPWEKGGQGLAQTRKKGFVAPAFAACFEYSPRKNGMPRFQMRELG